MSAETDEYRSLHFQDIRKKPASRTDTRTDNVKTVYPPTKFALCVCVCGGGGVGGGGGGGWRERRVFNKSFTTGTLYFAKTVGPTLFKKL